MMFFVCLVSIQTQTQTAMSESCQEKPQLRNDYCTKKSVHKMFFRRKEHTKDIKKQYSPGSSLDQL